jgi:integrase/recombinase XerD
VTPLRQRMLEELQCRNYSPATTCGYILAVKQFAEHFGRSPEKLGAEEVRRFQLYLVNDKELAPGTVERMSAQRFLYKKTLRRRDLAFHNLVFPQDAQKTAGRAEP